MKNCEKLLAGKKKAREINDHSYFSDRIVNDWGQRLATATGCRHRRLDNAGHRDGRNPLTSAGSNYGLHAPTRDVTRPVGEWNEARMVVDGPSVEHWLNGERIVAYELWTDEWTSMVAETKFAEWPQYGLARRGHVGLQDHGDPVWFRNIKILER